MTRSNATHIGDGSPALVLEQQQRDFSSMGVVFRSDDITRPTDWSIHDTRHHVVVHLGGHMRRLETELEGHGGSTGPALPGELWTAPAGRRYASHAVGARIHYAVLMVDPVANVWHDLRSIAAGRDEFLHQSVLRLRSVMRGSNDTDQMQSESLSEAIRLHLLRVFSPDAATASNVRMTRPCLNEKTARLLREFIHDQLGEPLALNDLAGLAGMTTHQLLIAFRRAFGSTPAQYIIQQRLREAQRQLQGTRLDITTIALDCGFASHSHLTACFSRHFGESPSEWRASCRKTSFQVRSPF